jgi:hypothetical protein
VQIPVLAPYVDDERDRRTQPRDVAEVLLGPDADVRTARRGKPPDVLGEVGLVGHEIVREAECSGWLGQILDQAPELLIAQSGRKRGSSNTAYAQQEEPADN